MIVPRWLIVIDKTICLMCPLIAIFWESYVIKLFQISGVFLVIKKPSLENQLSITWCIWLRSEHVRR